MLNLIFRLYHIIYQRCTGQLNESSGVGWSRDTMRELYTGGTIINNNQLIRLTTLLRSFERDAIPCVFILRIKKCKKLQSVNIV